MIPKILHYVWLGKKEKPKLIQKCILSWKRNLPGFEFKEWNETNFPIDENLFVKDAYKYGKYAFVSDYIRANVVEQFGGIYVDTDVMVIDNFDDLLANDCFVGFEKTTKPFTSVFGSVAHHPLIQDMGSIYSNKKFNINNLAALTNTNSVSKLLIENYHCLPNGKEQIIDDDIHVYPRTVLCDPSRESRAIHIRNGSWVPGSKNISTQIGVKLRSHITNKKQAAFYNELKQFQNKIKGI